MFPYLYLVLGVLDIIVGLGLFIFEKSNWRYVGLFLAIGLGIPVSLTALLKLGYI